MRFNPIEYYRSFKRYRANEKAERLQAEKASNNIRSNDALGPWTSTLGQFIPKKTDPVYLEAMREAVPLIDAAIDRLVELDGDVIVEGENAATVAIVQDFLDTVPVNDFDIGFNSFDNMLTAEVHEQGFMVSEKVLGPNGITRLVVADSKTIDFKREKNNELRTYQRVNGDLSERPLDENVLNHLSFVKEAGNAYGVARFRSCEFTTQVLLTIWNSMQNAWSRFGDPNYSIINKTKKASNADLKAQKNAIIASFTAAMEAKRQGKSADFVHVINRDDELTIGVIGAGGDVMEIAPSNRAQEELIVAKSGLPSWMIGLKWTSGERLSDAEANMISAGITMRQSLKLTVYTDIVSTHLRRMGVTWNKEDWKLGFTRVNLNDILKLAQAGFLNAQAEQMRTQAGLAPNELIVDDEGTRTSKGLKCGCDKHAHGIKEEFRTEAWPSLDTQEREYQARLMRSWSTIEQKTFMLTGLDGTGMAAALAGINKQDELEGAPQDEPPTFELTPAMETGIAAALAAEVAVWRPGAESPTNWYYGNSFSLGLEAGATLAGEAAPALNIVQNPSLVTGVFNDASKQITKTFTSAVDKNVLDALRGLELAGATPTQAAASLRQSFGDANSNWERLARTEMTATAEKGKLAEWKELGVNTQGSVIPGLDTHPRCRCANMLETLADGSVVVKFVPAPGACPICTALAT